jgi:MYXO-CTERM domain-containing protein
LLGAFTFDALQPASNSSISVQNVTLETFAAASNLGPPDIDPGTLPVATLDVMNATATPEPSSAGFAALAIVGGIFILRRQKRISKAS